MLHNCTQYAIKLQLNLASLCSLCANFHIVKQCWYDDLILTSPLGILLKNMGVFGLYFGNQWVMWNVQKVSNCINRNRLFPSSFFVLCICHVFDLIYLCKHRAPQEMPAGGKAGLQDFQEKRCWEKLNLQRGCEGTVCEEILVAVSEKTDPSASWVLTYLTYLRNSLSWLTQADTKHS